MPLYGLYYIRSSEALPDELCRQFIQGEHVTRRIAGAWNWMWRDMMARDRTNVMLRNKLKQLIHSVTSVQHHAGGILNIMNITR